MLTPKRERMHANRWYTVLVPLLLGLAGAHCGDDDRAEPVSVSTGLPRELKLSDFDDEDARAACEALNDGAAAIISDSELIRSQCASLAIKTTAKVNSAKTQITLEISECETAAKQCERTPVKYGITAQGGRDQEDCDEAVANQYVMACEATVGEYEACVSKVLGRAKETLASISCANGKALLQSDGETELDPLGFEECKLFLDKCPDVRITAAVGQ
jgi:hypothetical protein